MTLSPSLRFISRLVFLLATHWSAFGSGLSTFFFVSLENLFLQEFWTDHHDTVTARGRWTWTWWLRVMPVYSSDTIRILQESERVATTGESTRINGAARLPQRRTYNAKIVASNVVFGHEFFPYIIYIYFFFKCLSINRTSIKARRRLGNPTEARRNADFTAIIGHTVSYMYCCRPIYITRLATANRSQVSIRGQ